MKRALTAIAVNTSVAILMLLTLVPLWWMVVASVSPTGQSLADPPRLLPSAITFEHYETLVSRLSLPRFFANSVLIAASVTALALLVNSMAGYAFAKLPFRGRDAIFRALLLTLLIPAQVAMMPLFLMLRQCNLINSYWAVILPATASVYGIFLVRQYALSIPDSLLDAARMDGASEFRIFFDIVVPVIRPILVALGIFTFLAAWNDFMWPLIVLTDDRKFTLPVALAILSGEHVQDVELMMAGAVVTVLPVLILFLCFQRQLIGGIAAGSVKG
jgi:multiple sugar transport system permease protein